MASPFVDWATIPHTAKSSIMAVAPLPHLRWASVKAIAPDKFAKIAQYEAEFGMTINCNYSITELADRGTPYPETANKELVAEANDCNWNYPAIANPWQLPSGAFGELAGPV